MSNLNQTPSGERLHIGIFGRRNAGKSSIINAITGQNLSIVSDVKGTTTDPVSKAMELLPFGPVMLFDTPGLDDEGLLGEKRIEKALSVLNKTDVALLVVDSSEGKKDEDIKIEEEIKKRHIPYIIVYNKSDLFKRENLLENEISVFSETKENIELLKEKILSIVPKTEEKSLLKGIVSEGDTVILVIPIDKSAPKGRLILPQQQTIRDILDLKANSVVVGVEGLKSVIDNLKTPPRLVICDSQVFKAVAEIVPQSIPLTSFSILFARYKGDLEILTNGIKALENLKDGDRILISEGCTHHRQCGDIGSVKIPKMIENTLKIKPNYQFTSGGTFPESLDGIKLVIHCGGCMLNEREMKNRIEKAQNENTPIVNYGVLISHLSGILKRSLEIFDINDSI